MIFELAYITVNEIDEALKPFRSFKDMLMRHLQNGAFRGFNLNSAYIHNDLVSEARARKAECHI